MNTQPYKVICRIDNNNRLTATGSLIYCAELAYKAYKRWGANVDIIRRWNNTSIRMKSPKIPLP